MTLSQRRNIARRVAFTLMEMLVVVAIIVVLAGLGGYYFMGRLDAAKVDAARLQAETLSKAAETYKVDFGYFPSDLTVLLNQDPNTGKGPYLERQDALKDPWGQYYLYDMNGSIHRSIGYTVPMVDIYTTVPDGTNRQVGNWKN